MEIQCVLLAIPNLVILTESLAVRNGPRSKIRFLSEYDLVNQTFFLFFFFFFFGGGGGCWN
jgi:hypothetical protein